MKKRKNWKKEREGKGGNKKTKYSLKKPWLQVTGEGTQQAESEAELKKFNNAQILKGLAEVHKKRDIWREEKTSKRMKVHNTKKGAHERERKRT